MEKFAEHVYIINREDRPDRKEHAILQTKQLGIDNMLTVWKAVNPDETKVKWKPNPTIDGWNKYAAALNMSTIQVLEDAKEKGYEKIVILEDDVMFIESSLIKIRELGKRLDNTHWDLFHFGHLPIQGREAISIGNGLVRLRGSYMCHAYAIQGRVFDDLITLLKKMDQPLDWVTSGVFHRGGRCYSVEPAIASQKPDYSNIRNEDVNYKMR